MFSVAVALVHVLAQTSVPAYTVVLPILGTLAVAIIAGWFGLASARVTAAAQKAQKVATEKAAEASTHADTIREKDELIDALKARVEFCEQENQRLKERMNEYDVTAQAWSTLQREYERRLGELERASGH